MYAQLCSSRAKYSRRLLSILAQQHINNKKGKCRVVNSISIMSLLLVSIIYLIVVSNKEKKTEHTRMYAQLCSLKSAIFTSVVVYSRTTSPQTKSKKNERFVVATSF